MKRAVIAGIFLAALAVFCVSGYRLWSYRQEDRASAQMTETLRDQAVTVREPETATAPAQETAAAQETEAVQESQQEIAPIQVDFDLLWQENPDIVAWLYSPDTPIDFPVVQTTDNSYYLRRLLDGSYNASGTSFVDYRCSGDFSDFNTMIYGHNMKNDAMFGTLVNYKDQSYYDSHPVLYLITPAQAYRVDLVAGFQTSSEDDIYLLPQQSDTGQVAQAAANSTFAAQTQIQPGQRYVTLSTCDYDYEEARFVLIGALTPLES
jgi:sortase B